MPKSLIYSSQFTFLHSHRLNSLWGLIIFSIQDLYKDMLWSLIPQSFLTSHSKLLDYHYRHSSTELSFCLCHFILSSLRKYNTPLIQHNYSICQNLFFQHSLMHFSLSIASFIFAKSQRGDCIYIYTKQYMLPIHKSTHSIHVSGMILCSNRSGNT